ncbi:MAG TPA: oligosaccharide flippase family protein [Bacteroidales bacterium]|nr:oligosaccharide flippase family protein [Bacteroidales bacterium]HPA13456.1 oligosaccharide flippase family protein [Bacteroidales bacterium]HQO07327.1 oligosaccharide flippase family protein [Bacteroidales bacterium]HQP52759.1 oligosaccharide flippase family protein [Bacteroidales bacterium]
MFVNRRIPITFFNRIRGNASNIGIYMLASIIPMFIHLVTNPLIALNMTPVDYAIVGYFTSFNSLLTPLITFYAFAYYTKRYFELADNERLVLKATIFKSLIFFSFILATISFIVLFLYMKLLNKDSTMPFFPYAFLSIFTIPLGGIITLQLTDYKMERKSKSYFKLSVSQGLTGVGLSLLLVVGIKLGAFGKLSATFISTGLIFLYVLISKRSLMRIKFEKTVFKAMLLFVWPLIIGVMLHFFTSGYDRVYLERLGNSNELGYYVVAAQMAGFIGVFRSAVSSTFQPDIYKAIVKRKWKSAFKYFSLILGSVSFFVTIFVFFAPIVIDLLTAGRYTYSAKYARILAFSQLTTTMYYLTTESIVVLGFTFISLISKIIGVLITILLYWVLISKWQFTGAAIGQVLSYLLMMSINLVFIFFLTRKLKKNEA